MLPGNWTPRTTTVVTFNVGATSRLTPSCSPSCPRGGRAPARSGSRCRAACVARVARSSRSGSARPRRRGRAQPPPRARSSAREVLAHVVLLAVDVDVARAERLGSPVSGSNAWRHTQPVSLVSRWIETDVSAEVVRTRWMSSAAGSARRSRRAASARRSTSSSRLPPGRSPRPACRGRGRRGPRRGGRARASPRPAGRRARTARASASPAR